MTDKLNSDKSQKIALITGANRGIGLATAKILANQEGITVLATARQPNQAVELNSIAEKVYPLDVADTESCEALHREVIADFGQVDILINNAGVALDKWQSGLELSVQVLQQTLETNLYGPLRLCQLFIPEMKRTGYGRVVNLSTELASLNEMEMGSTVAYRSSKTALNAITKLLALELKDYPNILVNAVCPGWVLTELGGEGAPLTPEQGADTVVWAALLGEGEPTGSLFRERAIYPW